MISVGPLLRRVLFSSTIVYHYPAAEFSRRRRAVEDRLTGRVSPSVAEDFAAIRDSVLSYMPTASVPRYGLPLVIRPGGHFLGGLTSNSMEAASFVSVAEAYSSLSVTLNFRLEDTSVDELIALSQSGYGRRCPRPLLVDIDSRTTRAHSLMDVHTHVANLLEIKEPYYVKDHFRCIELGRVGSCVTAMQAANRYSRALYGILVSDEGWRHVGETTALEVVTKMWTTRSFVGVVALGDGCLMINLQSPDYNAAQRRFFATFFGDDPDYFSREVRVAVLNHGAFLAMELCSYRKCIVDDLGSQLKRQSWSSSPEPLTILAGIRHRVYRRSLYRSLLHGMQRLQLNPPTELGALDNLVENRSGLPERLQYLHQVLQAFEAEEQVNFMYRVNSIMAIFTALGIVVAVVSTIIAVLVAS